MTRGPSRKQRVADLLELGRYVFTTNSGTAAWTCTRCWTHGLGGTREAAIAAAEDHRCKRSRRKRQPTF